MQGEAAELNAVVAMLVKAHAGLEACYNQARELYKPQRETHNAELAAAKSAKAAPGSRADIKNAQSEVRNAARVRENRGRGVRHGPWADRGR